ncbi:MAG: hypothetical protein JNK15_13430 [Planctomycetes bacterium]|nr:hypothetical protein [Planctomycetota bacterium]
MQKRVRDGGYVGDYRISLQAARGNEAPHNATHVFVPFRLDVHPHPMQVDDEFAHREVGVEQDDLVLALRHLPSQSGARNLHRLQQFDRRGRRCER